MAKHKSLRGLARRMFQIAESIPLIGARKARVAAIGALEVLIEQTPVDTGEAVSNWQVGIGSPPVGTIPAYVPGNAQSTADVNRAIAIRVGEGRIKRYIGIGGPIHITNNVAHIERLNDGSSPQNSGGFVEEAVLVAELASRKVRVSI